MAAAVSCDVLYQFYQRYRILVHIPKDVSAPLLCVANYGYHMVSQCSLLGLQVPPTLERGDVLEAENTTRFILGLMYLTYFVYKMALKRVPFVAVYTFSDYALVR